MLQSRRGFLIGVAGLLTTAFVSDARSIIRRTGRPLLASPSQVAQTLHWYEVADDGYRLTLGEWTTVPPPAPTWREFFVSEGIAHQTEDEAYGHGPTTPFGRRTTTSPLTSVTGRIVSNARMVPLPRPIACSVALILGPEREEPVR